MSASFDTNPLLTNDPGFTPPPPARVPPRDQGYQPVRVAAPPKSPALGADPVGDRETIIDALAEDAAPPKWPADAPGLWPYLQLPFRQRADFFRVYQQLQEKQSLLKELRELAKADSADGQAAATTSASTASQVFELYAVMDDLMSICSTDKERYRAWVGSHTDEEFAQLFAAFMSRTQPGEASSSAS